MMTHDHVDTPDRVEKMAIWHEGEAAHLRAHHALQGSMPELAEMHEETAAMLRGLHARVVDAEQARDSAQTETARWKLQSDDWQTRGWELGHALEAAEAALATAREHALREAAKVAFIAASTGKEGRPVRDAILALIPQPTTPGET